VSDLICSERHLILHLTSQWSLSIIGLTASVKRKYSLLWQIVWYFVWHLKSKGFSYEKKNVDRSIKSFTFKKVLKRIPYLFVWCNPKFPIELLLLDHTPVSIHLLYINSLVHISNRLKKSSHSCCLEFPTGDTRKTHHKHHFLDRSK